MPHITVDEEQARVISGSSEDIEIRDRNGRYLGHITHGFTNDEIAIAKQRLASDEPHYTTDQVMGHLKTFERGFPK